VPEVHEDDPLRAVRAASDMRLGLARLGGELEGDWGVSLDVRIGIASGRVVTGIDPGPTLVTGATVNLAARLEQVAGAGEILIADETYRLVRYDVEMEPAGPFSLKGFGDGIQAHRLIGSVPAAGPSLRRRESPLVDREPELERFQRTLDRVIAERRCHLLTVLGPPGVGKSRLVDEFREVTPSDARWLKGRCLSYGEGITFWPVAEFVKEATGLADTDPVPTAARKIVDALPGAQDAELVATRIGQLLDLFGGPQAPDETFWAIRRFLEGQAHARPLVLVLEDIHWAEPTFLGAVEHVVERSRGTPILLLCLAREELLEVHPGWGDGMDNSIKITLGPLARSDTSVLVENFLGAGTVAPAMRERIVGRAEGFPLLAEEIVSTLVDEGRLVLEGGRWASTTDLSRLSLPTTISGLMAARLERLNPGERAVIERASVVGRDFLASEVAALSPNDQRDLVEARLDGLVGTALLRQTEAPVQGEGAYRFRHMLLLDAAYEGMHKTSRAELHERYAEWLQAWTRHRSEKYEEVLAYHLEQAYLFRSDVGPPGRDLDDLAVRAAHRLSRVGHLAGARGDMPAAANLLGRARRLLPRGASERNALLHQLGLALWQAGDVDQVEAVYLEELEVGRASGDVVLEARSSLALTELRMELDPGAITPETLREEAELAAKIFESAGADEDLADALLILGTTHWLAGRLDRMLDVSSRALALARTAGSATGATNYVGRSLVLGRTHCDDALMQLEALAAEFVDDLMLEATAGLDLATIYAMVDRPEDAIARVDRSLSVFEELGQGRWVAEGNHTKGLVSWLGDDARTAEQAIRSAHDWFEQRGEILELASTSTDLALVLLDLDRVEDADMMAESSSSTGAPYDLEAQIGWRLAKGRTLAMLGERMEGERLLREALEVVSRTQFLNLRGAVFSGLAATLASSPTAGAADAAHEASVSYGRKGNRVGVRKAEALLASL
jgi:tetratricopeptide (TPR) repeat protein